MSDPESIWRSIQAEPFDWGDEPESKSRSRFKRAGRFISRVIKRGREEEALPQSDVEEDQENWGFTDWQDENWTSHDNGYRLKQ